MGVPVATQPLAGRRLHGRSLGGDVPHRSRWRVARAVLARRTSPKLHRGRLPRASSSAHERQLTMTSTSVSTGDRLFAALAVRAAEARCCRASSTRSRAASRRSIRRTFLRIFLQRLSTSTWPKPCSRIRSPIAASTISSRARCGPARGRSRREPDVDRQPGRRHGQSVRRDRRRPDAAGEGTSLFAAGAAGGDAEAVARVSRRQLRLHLSRAVQLSPHSHAVCRQRCAATCMCPAICSA